jgi:hypothetical protein
MAAYDRWLVWFEDSVLGRIDVYWPPGYGVRFEPEAVVMSPSGAVVLRDGQFVSESRHVCAVESGSSPRRVSWNEEDG